MSIQGANTPEAASRRRSFVGGAILAGILGGGFTGAAIVTVGLSGSPDGSTAADFDLQLLPLDDLFGAVTTIAPPQAGYMSRAVSCRVPLASVVVFKQGAPAGKVRIKSANYVSPEFELTDAPQRVAIPFPAPYEAGSGVISIEGDLPGTSVGLMPVWHFNSDTGVTTINVRWTPKAPCFK